MSSFSFKKLAKVFKKGETGKVFLRGFGLKTGGAISWMW
jgi:hypothetical protein